MTSNRGVNSREYLQKKKFEGSVKADISLKQKCSPEAPFLDLPFTVIGLGLIRAQYNLSLVGPLHIDICHACLIGLRLLSDMTGQ